MQQSKARVRAIEVLEDANQVWLASLSKADFEELLLTVEMILQNEGCL